MKRSRFSESQIIRAIKENENGRSADEICCELGMPIGTFYNRTKKYSGSESSQLQELKQLQSENAKLRRIYAELAIQKYDQSISFICRSINLARSTKDRTSTNDDSVGEDKLLELAESYQTHGLDWYYSRLGIKARHGTESECVRTWKIQSLTYRLRYRNFKWNNLI